MSPTHTPEREKAFTRIYTEAIKIFSGNQFAPTCVATENKRTYCLIKRDCLKKDIHGQEPLGDLLSRTHDKLMNHLIAFGWDKSEERYRKFAARSPRSYYDIQLSDPNPTVLSGREPAVRPAGSYDVVTKTNYRETEDRDIGIEIGCFPPLENLKLLVEEKEFYSILNSLLEIVRVYKKDSSEPEHYGHIAEDTIKRLKDELEKLAGCDISDISDISDLRMRIKTKEIKDLKEEIKDAEVEDLKVKTDRIDELHCEIESIQSKMIDELKKENHSQSTEVHRLLDVNTEQSQKIADLGSTNSGQLEEIALLEDTKSELLQKIADLIYENHTQWSKIRDLNREKHTQSEAIDNSNTKLQTFKDKTIKRNKKYSDVLAVGSAFTGLFSLVCITLIAVDILMKHGKFNDFKNIALAVLSVLLISVSGILAGISCARRNEVVDLEKIGNTTQRSASNGSSLDGGTSTSRVDARPQRQIS